MRTSILPYGRQQIEADDIQAVVDVLNSDWLTTGPKIEEFESSFAAFCGVCEAVAVSSGTAALHAAMHTLDIGPGDEVIVPALTFAATANSVVYQGATPVFADVTPDTLLLDPASVEREVTSRTKAIIAVDYAGQPCDYDILHKIASHHKLALVADACHALGASDKQRPVGSLADISTFSLHPVKPITSGEGGVVTTDNASWARRMRQFRNHGITTDHRQREKEGSWFYEMTELGFNYRLTDFQCALAQSQLKKLPGWVERRQEIAQRYDEFFLECPFIEPLTKRTGVSHAYHLYVIKLDLEELGIERAEVFQKLRDARIGVNVHYVPVYWHPFYREKFGYEKGLCPVTEAAYERILSLPIFPAMNGGDMDAVIDALDKALKSI